MGAAIAVFDEDGVCRQTFVDDRILSGDSSSRCNARNDVASLWDLLPRVGSLCSRDVAEAKRLLRERNFRKALSVLERSRCEDAESLNLRGVLHELLDRHDDARRYYGKAMAAEKEFWAAELNLRRCYELSAFGSSDIPLLV
jgi:tetratricopeptide (TPR) repeat protein